MSGYNTIRINNCTIELNKPVDEQLITAGINYSDQPKLATFLNNWRSETKTIRQQTSGSTGTPKQIELKKGAMLASAKLTCNHFKLDNTSTLLMCLDLDYIAGKMMVVRALFSGANLILRSPIQLHQAYPKEHIDFVALIPVQLQTLIYNKVQLDHTAQILLGGAPITEAQKIQFETLNSEIWQSYATTETCSHVALRRINGNNATSHYSALPNIHFSVTTDNCLVIEANQLLDAPLATNDVIELINNHTFNWLGRSDFIINSGGIKVSPEAIENSLSHLITTPYYISSKKNDRFGQEICLVIERQTPFNSEVENQLLLKIKETLPPYHAPRLIIYVSELPKTANGKLKRERY